MRLLHPLLALFLVLGCCSYSVGQTSATEPPRWGEEPVLELAPQRGEVVLNGPWQFAPAVGKPESVSGRGWGMIWVPGTWSKPGKLPGLVARGEGAAWTAFGDGRSTVRAWLRRPVRIPRTWTGRAVLLDFERVSTDAVVRVNGKVCGRVRWPEGTVEITDAVTAGQDAEVVVEVAATSDPAEADRLLKAPAERLDTNDDPLDTRGITGDVVLLSRPKGPHLTDVSVQPSVRKKELGLRLELAGVERAGPMTVEVTVVDMAEQTVKQFTATPTLRAAPGQTLDLSWPWKEPEYWDPGRPTLYNLKLKVSSEAAKVSDGYHLRFGFRELWVEGRRLILNGIPYRVRPVSAPGTSAESRVGGNREAIRAQIEQLIRLGFNLQLLPPEDQLVRGSYQGWSQWYDLADEMGWPMVGKAVAAAPYLRSGEQPVWSDRKSRYRTDTVRDLRRIRNHPSIVMWMTDGTAFDDVADQDPKKLGRGAAADRTAAREAIGIVKELDPTRPAITYAGGGIGDLYTTRMDLNLTPLQEREEWLSEWSTTGELPFAATEFGLPRLGTFLRGRGGATENLHSEPWATEYQAIYLGRRAYELETEAYRKEIAARFAPGEGRGEYRSWAGNAALVTAPGMQELQSLFLTNTLRSWRTAGLSGGLSPAELGTLWTNDGRENQEIRQGSYQPGIRGTHQPAMRAADLYPFAAEGGYAPLPALAALRANNTPLLAWIAGPPAAMTAKDHSFRTGQAVQKSIVIVNDQRRPQPYAFGWQVVVGGKPLVLKGGKGLIQPGQTLTLPIAFTTPAAIAGRTADGAIRLEARIGAMSLTDKLDFRVFGKPSPLPGSMLLFDPAGKTTKLLSALGLPAAPWTGKPGTGLLVIGRDALTSGKPLPGSLDAFARAGGRVVVLGQAPEFLRTRLGFRVARHVSRRVFPLASTHPVTQGLDERDLRDWAGSSTVLPSYSPSPLESGKDLPPTPRWGWHWGNRGAVTSAAVEKPHLSGWRPILECEFDLAYSPLMELDRGSGRVLLCTLDLEDHVAADPAAERLARQLFAYALKPLPPAKEGRVVLAGGDGSLLDTLRLRYEKSATLDPAAELNILGPGAQVEAAALTSYLEKGGRVLRLSQRPGTTDVGVRTGAEAVFPGSAPVPSWPEAAGLSPSDLHTRTPFPAVLLQDGAELGASGLLGRKVVGKGVLISCQLDPARLDADRKTYLRFTRWRQTRAIAQLLANLGGTFEADHTVLTGPPATPFYLPDYRSDFALGDDPYRYRRW